MNHSSSYSSVLEAAGALSGSRTPVQQRSPAQYGELMTKLAAIKAGAKEKDAYARISAMNTYRDLAKDVSTEDEAFVANSLSVVCELFGDKDKNVRDAAEQAGREILHSMQRYSLCFVLPALFEAIRNPKWQAKLIAVNLLKGVTSERPAEVRSGLHGALPFFS